MSKATKVWALIAGTLIAACDQAPTDPFSTMDAEMAAAEPAGGSVAHATGVRGGDDAKDQARDRQRPDRGGTGDEAGDRRRPERDQPERERPERDRPGDAGDRPDRDRPGEAGDRRHPDRWRRDAERRGGEDHGPEARARAAIADALDLYGRIAEQVERDDRPALVAALSEANTMIDQAIDAYDAGDFSRALVKAQQALDVLHEIARVLGDDPDDGPQARARAAIADALDLYGRIAEQVERDDRPALVAALSEARTMIEQATDAFDAGDFSRALVKAQQALDVLHEIARVLG